MTTARVTERTGSNVVVLPIEGHGAGGLPLWKRGIDILVSAMALLVLFPVMLALSVAIMLESRGGPFYRHTRVGRGGRTFTCWKFRSMHAGAEEKLAGLMERNEANGPIFKLRDDPRRTRFGVALRKTCLDELPQFWNVLRGDMSVVGPRPPLVPEVAQYSAWHMQRLRGTPGITGLWQVTPHRQYDFEEMVRLDVEYWDRMSFGLDLKLMVLTVWTMVRGRGS